MPAETQTLGLIAGSGDLARRIAHTNPDMPVICLKGAADLSDYTSHPVLSLRPAQVGRMLRFFHDHHVTGLVLAGGLRRPSLLSLWPDWGGVKALCHCGLSYFSGDDALLRRLRSYLEGQGIRVIGADQILPDLVLQSGETLGVEGDSGDVAAVLPVLRQHALADKGQAMLVHPDGGYHLEDAQGTAALIRHHGQAGSILVKMMKPQQDPDLDRPVIGPETMDYMHECGGAGVLVQAGTVFILNREAVVQRAAQYGLFVKGVDFE